MSEIEAGKTKLHKECFITVGATATFEQLIRATLSDEVLTKLREKGFTHLNYQYGNSSELFHELLLKDQKDLRLVINGFGFKPKGLGDDIKRCKRVDGNSEEGLVISHAGWFSLRNEAL